MIITIRKANSNDLEEILQLFRETIETVNAKDYSPEQIKVWKNGALKKERWLKKISEQCFLLAEIDNQLAGFGSITHDGHLDFMYVNKNNQNIGVASKLYDSLEKFAKGTQVNKIISDVSITAKPFFEKQGFKLVQEQQVDIERIRLTNYKMEKHLGLR